MRKITVLLLLLISVLFLLINSGIFGSGIVYPPNNIPFSYDPNFIIDGLISTDPDVWGPKLLGGIDVRAGQEVIVDIKCKDADGDAFSIRVLNWQAGMNLIVSNDPNNPTELKWTPTAEQEGLHYINVESWDFPPDPNDSLFDRGTLIFYVRPKNRPPILYPCGL